MTNLKKIFKIKNKCGMDLSQTEELFHSLGDFAQKRFGFKKPPTLNLVSDQDNASKPLGKTAYYDPQSMSVTIYTDNRHTKDILRSLAHELVHHTQNENGMLNDSGYHGSGYAQKNKDLRQSEKEAYLKGNMCFRDWEDGLKQSKPTIYNEWRIKNMSTKKWKNNELMENLSEKFGFKMDLSLLKEGAKPDFPDIDGDGDKEEPISKAQKDKKEKESGKKSEEDSESEESEESKPKSKKGKLNPGLQKYLDSKKKKNETMDKKKRDLKPRSHSQNVLRSYQVFVDLYKGQEISPKMEEMIKMLMSAYEKNLKGVKESLYNIENNLEKFQQEAFANALDDISEDLQPNEYQELAGFLGQTSTQPIPAPFPGDDSPQISNRNISNAAEAMVMALKRISSISKVEKE